MSATGNKVKGKHSIDLVWSNTPSNMDVLESGSLVAENVAGTTFTHNTGNKRSATYFYQVCETGGTVVCSNEVMVVY